ncbi:MAG: transketolase [Pseudomonadota bacterium]
MNPLLQLIEHGQSYWLDNLSRDKIVSGELARRVRDEGLRGVTSNPAIFHKAMSATKAYDEQLRQLAGGAARATALYHALTTRDVQMACDILRPVYEETQGRDGYVSLEVSPHLAHDADASIAEAKELAQWVGRPNLFIKIPGTRAGVSAVEQLLREGINVNITLLFGIEQYDAVAQAYLRALEHRLAAQQEIRSMASVASFFLSRIDVLVDELLAQRIVPGSDSPLSRQAGVLRGKAALANAKLAYQHFRTLLASERWQRLAAHGAQVQRMLWASTGTKNPDYPDLMYVEPLIGADTINTMPDQTIAAFMDHGRVRTTVEEDLSLAEQTMASLAEVHIDFAAVANQLQDEGIAKFIEPYDATLTLLEQTRHRGQRDSTPLAQMARKLRHDVLRMTTAAGSGHPTSCLSCADIVATLFFNTMHWDPADPAARDVDTFILSKGHAAPILWAALAEAGAIEEDLLSLRRVDSTLEGHPTPRNPWIKVATGSLGQGLAAANGIALANRLDGLDEARVYCLLGDAECSEGAVWEAAQFAALNGLKNLVAIVDLNGLGQSEPTPYGHNTAVLAQRFAAFGWRTCAIDGHDIDQVMDALDQARTDGPTAIIAHTVKGKGVSFLEDAEGWHGKALDEEQLKRALTELGEVEVNLRVVPRRLGGYQPAAVAATPSVSPRYRMGDMVATRAAFGRALAELGAQLPHLVVLDGDVKNSTHTEDFARAYPERFFQGHIAEQNMIGTALGLSAVGKIPVAATFAAFLARAYDFIRMAGHTHPGHLVLAGSHAGVSIGQDGPSQMGLEDLAEFRALPDSTVLYPCDAVSAQRLTAAALTHRGLVYLRLTRGNTPVIYTNDEEFPPGASKVLRTSAQDTVTLVAAGITVHEALAAHDELHAQGIAARVIDAYSIKPLDRATLLQAARETGRIIVIEDHWADGGLGDAVATALCGSAVELIRLAVTQEPRSGTPHDLMQRYGISREVIVDNVLGTVTASS